MMKTNAVLEPTTEDLLELYQVLKTTEAKLWRDGPFNELARLVQGSKKQNIKGTNTINLISPNQKPINKRATYARIVVSYRPQKEDPYQFQITVGGEKSTMQVKPLLQIMTLTHPNASSTVLSAPNLLNS